MTILSGAFKAVDVSCAEEERLLAIVAADVGKLVVEGKPNG